LRLPYLVALNIISKCCSGLIDLDKHDTVE
jgi:hypothetical protein